MRDGNGIQVLVNRCAHRELKAVPISASFATDRMRNKQGETAAEVAQNASNISVINLLQSAQTQK